MFDLSWEGIADETLIIDTPDDYHQYWRRYYGLEIEVKL